MEEISDDIFELMTTMDKFLLKYLDSGPDINLYSENICPTSINTNTTKLSVFTVI